MDDNTSTTNPDFKNDAQTVRTELARVAELVYALKGHPVVQVQGGANTGEIIANVMLAFRHVEDAAMRVGKAIQASDTGVSPLGGPTTPAK